MIEYIYNKLRNFLQLNILNKKQKKYLSADELTTQLRHGGKSSAQTKQGYLWIVVRIESSDTEMKRVETQSKVMALDISQNSSGRGSAE